MAVVVILLAAVVVVVAVATAETIHHNKQLFRVTAFKHEQLQRWQELWQLCSYEDLRPNYAKAKYLHEDSGIMLMFI